MKKNILILITLLTISCSSDEDKIIETKPSFTIDVKTNNTSVAVDQNIKVIITSEEDLIGIGLSGDNFVTPYFRYPGSVIGKTITLNYRFTDIGEKTLYFQGVKKDNILSEIKSITFNISKGTSVKILSLKINKFDRINTSWDPEFSNTDSNRLADIGFAITKLDFYNPFESTLNQKSWYKSEIKENQGDLTWDLSNLNLYLNPDNNFNFSIADIDTYPLGQDLMKTSLPVQFSLASYKQTKPSTVTLTYPDNDLEFVIGLEWPN